MKDNSVDYADKSAILISALCIAHCILPPLLILFSPVIAGMAFFAEESVHLWLVGLVLPISVIAIGGGFLRHRNSLTLITATLGLLIIVVAAIFGHDVFGHEAEVVMTIIGSVILVYSHVRNIRLRRQTANSARS